MMPDAPTPSPTAVQVEIDVKQNVLRMRFRGIVRAVDADRDLAGMAQSLSKLAGGFTLVTDLTGLESMELDCVRSITRVMDLCRKASIGQVIRVIPDPDKDIGLNLLSLVHYRGKVPTVTVETRAEAEKKLALH